MTSEQEAEKRSSFREELESLINRHSFEARGGDTPDFILAAFLAEQLEVFDRTVRARDRWYGFRNFGGDDQEVLAGPPPFSGTDDR